MFTIIAVIGLALLAFLAYAATRPNSFRTERSTRIKANPETVFALVNDFHQWRLWSPWENLDPELKRTYSGAEAAKGAVYAYEGSSKVGAGRMEILEATVPARILIKLDFYKPFKASNTAEFTFVPDGADTVVTWAMFGPQPYVGKVMSTVFNIDRLVGPQFEQGLATMKHVAEH